MGGEDKEKNTTKVSGRRDHVKDVFNTSMSRLLQDFSSAELFSNTSEVPKGANSYPDSYCETVVTSMKHLHLRRPVVTKQKKSRIGALKKKNSSNTLNLAVAACGYQRPIVWPARLSSHSEKCQSNVLRPSRLPMIKKGTSDQETKPPTNTYATDTEKLSQSQDCIIFGSSSSADHSSLSFSSLCEQATENCKDGKNVQEHVSSSTHSHHRTIGHAKTLCKRQSTSPTPPAKFARTLVEDSESGASQTVFLDYRKSGSPYSCHSSYDSTYKPLLLTDETTGHVPDVSSDQAVVLSSPSGLETLTTHRSALTSCDHSVSQSPPESTCHSSSQEPRLEETNVNELSSYFEDLLHIPRKMSIMAEMMYA